MKIVQVQTQAEAAGAQRISDMVGHGLRERGHEVRTVFMYRKTHAFDLDPYADFILREEPRGVLGRARAAFGLARYLSRARPDAVITFQHYGNIIGAVAARWAGVRRVVANQSGAPQTMGVLASIDKVIGSVGLYQANVVNSEWTKAQFDHYPHGYQKIISHIDHGVPVSSTRFDKAEARAKFGLPQHVWLVVTSGRIVKSKNHLVLVAALESLPDVHMALAGVGPEQEALVDCAGRHGVLDRVHLVGEVPPEQMFEFLATGDAYAFPSLTETFGLAAVEAAMAGLPIVANNLDVLREVLTTQDGRSAALFVGANAQDMARGLAELKAKPQLAAALSSAGLQLKQKYSVSRMCAGYEALLQA